MTGINNSKIMMTNRFLVILITSFLGYFVLDFVFSNAMLYIMGGIVGGTIIESFEVIGITPGMPLIGLVWMTLLIGLVLLFYGLGNNILKYFTAVLIGVLLYVIDMFFMNISYPNTIGMESITASSDIVIGFLILLKSVILSLVIYTGIRTIKIESP